MQEGGVAVSEKMALWSSGHSERGRDLKLEEVGVPSGEDVEHPTEQLRLFS